MTSSNSLRTCDLCENACGINSDFGCVLADDLGRLADLIDPPRKGRGPCAHGDVCRAYMRERGVILRCTCSRCEHYEPRGD